MCTCAHKALLIELNCFCPWCQGFHNITDFHGNIIVATLIFNLIFDAQIWHILQLYSMMSICAEEQKRCHPNSYGSVGKKSSPDWDFVIVFSDKACGLVVNAKSLTDNFHCLSVIAWFSILVPFILLCNLGEMCMCMSVFKKNKFKKSQIKSSSSVNTSSWTERYTCTLY